ncbi:MAG: hypothetical protein WD824_20820 [Cyclobacteriaceae bacterium]
MGLRTSYYDKLIESSTKRYSPSEWGEIFPENFLINNMESNHNAFMNKNASDVLGYSPTEIKQMGSEYFVKFFKPEDLLGF